MKIKIIDLFIYFIFTQSNYTYCAKNTGIISNYINTWKNKTNLHKKLMLNNSSIKSSEKCHQIFSMLPPQYLN